MQKVIQIRCFDKCIYNLNFPEFFEDSSIAKSKRLFQYLFRYDYEPGNDETIAFLDNALPALIEEKKEIWKARSKDFSDGYLSTDRAALPAYCHYKEQIRNEVKRRKESNDKLFRAVKSAKSKHDHAQKVWESYTAEKQKFI